MAAILGGMLAWNLLTDWVWIGSSLGFLPKGAQEDLQKRALDIINLLKSAKDLIYQAQKTKRQLTASEKTLVEKTVKLAKTKIDDLYFCYKDKFLLYGKTDVVDAMGQTVVTLLQEIKNLKIMAGIVSPARAAKAKIEATVVSVHDGDTLTLDNGEIVRLVGIDAPESVTEAGMASRKFLIDLVLGKKVRVESDPAKMMDMYNRRLGVIWIGETNINVEMLKNGYAEYYPFEPNVLIFEKVWKAAAKEGKETGIKQPLADLKVVRSDQKEKLRMWKTDARATAKLTIDAEVERLRDESKDQLEELKDDYAMLKEELRETYKDNKTAIADAYKSKEITINERKSKLSSLRTKYLKARRNAMLEYRKKKLGIRDPHKAEKKRLKGLLRKEYKKINNEYRAKIKEINLSYNKSVTLIRTRKKITILPEVKLPTYVAPEITSVAPEMPAPPVVTPPVVTPPVVTPPVVTFLKIVTSGPKGIRFRTGPGTQYPVKYSVAAGPKFSAVGVVTGEMVEGENRWWKISGGVYAWVGATIEKP